MALEIERKFLVVSDAWRAGATRVLRLTQGYLKFPDDGVSEVRVRLTEEDGVPPTAQLTIKSCGSTVRTEVEKEISALEASELFALCQGTLIQKTRHHVPVDDLTVEVDVYEGALTGLVTADIELPTEDTPIPPLAYLGAEISANRSFANATMARVGVPDLQTTDDAAVLQTMRAIVATHGAGWAANYDAFLDDNHTFDPYWETGVEAIRTNTLATLVFADAALLEVGRTMEGKDPRVILMSLAIALGNMADNLVQSKTPQGPTP